MNIAGDWIVTKCRHCLRYRSASAAAGVFLNAFRGTENKSIYHISVNRKHWQICLRCLFLIKRCSISSVLRYFTRIEGATHTVTLALVPSVWNELPGKDLAIWDCDSLRNSRKMYCFFNEFATNYKPSQHVCIVRLYNTAQIMITGMTMVVIMIMMMMIIIIICFDTVGWATRTIPNRSLLKACPKLESLRSVNQKSKVLYSVASAGDWG